MPRRNVSTHCSVEFVSSHSMRIPWASWSLRNGKVRPIDPMDEQLGWRLGDCNPCLDACKSSIRGRIRATDGATSPSPSVPNLRPMLACNTELLLSHREETPTVSCLGFGLSLLQTNLPSDYRFGSNRSLIGTFDGFDRVVGGTRGCGGGRGKKPTVCSSTTPDTMRWRRLESDSPPSPRRGHAAACVRSEVWDGEMVVVHGGEDLGDARGPGKLLEDVVVYHLGSQRWFRPVEGVQGNEGEEKNGPGPRANHVCFVVGSSLYVVGGKKPDGPAADVWKLDTNTWRWTQVTEEREGRPSARSAAAVATSADEKHVVLHGGSNGSKCLGDTHVLHLEGWTWSTLPTGHTGPSPRSHHTINIINDHVLLFGGKGSSGTALNDLWVLKEFKTGKDCTWSKLDIPGTTPTGRWGHAAVSTATAVIFVGGRGDSGWITKKEVYYDNVVVINRASVQWMHAVGLTGPAACMCHSLTMLRSTNQVLLIGGFDGKSSLDQTWLLEEGNDNDRITKQTFSSSSGAGQDIQSSKVWKTLGEFGQGILNKVQKGSPRVQHESQVLLEAPVPQLRLDEVASTVFPSEEMAVLRKKLGLQSHCKPHLVNEATGDREQDPLDLKCVERTLRKNPHEIEMHEVGDFQMPLVVPSSIFGSA